MPSIRVKRLTAVAAAGIVTAGVLYAVTRPSERCAVVRSLPDARCTPGAVLPSIGAEQICVRGYARQARDVPASVRSRVYQDYGIAQRAPGEYEVDHLISLELGGSNDIKNLWPQPGSPPPGYHEKDWLEDALHAEVCSGQITLEEAQRAISADWVSAYRARRGAIPTP